MQQFPNPPKFLWGQRYLCAVYGMLCWCILGVCCLTASQLWANKPMIRAFLVMTMMMILIQIYIILCPSFLVGFVFLVVWVTIYRLVHPPIWWLLRRQARCSLLKHHVCSPSLHFYLFCWVCILCACVWEKFV